MPGITYPYNLCGIKVPGYTTSSTEAEGETLLRYLVTRGVLSSNSNDSNLAFKKQTYKGPGVSCKQDHYSPLFRRSSSYNISHHKKRGAGGEL